MRPWIVSIVVLLSLAIPEQSLADITGDHTGSGNAIVISADVYSAAGGGAGAGYEYSVTQLPCSYRWDDAEGDARCVAASCPDSPADDPENQWRWAQVKQRVAGSGEPWTVLGTSCLNFAVIAPQVTPEMAYQQMLQLLPVLDFGYQPDVEGLVNLPVIVYTDPQQDWTFPPVILLDQAVVIRSTAIGYTWSFGGVQVPANWPGRPYADDCSPVTCEGYVSFPFTERGEYQIGLTVTWTGEFSVNGGAWQPVSDVGTTISPPQAVTILEAHAVLTDPYD